MSADNFRRFLENSREFAQIVGGQNVQSMRVKDQTYKKTRTLYFSEKGTFLLAQAFGPIVFLRFVSSLFFSLLFLPSFVAKSSFVALKTQKSYLLK